MSIIILNAYCSINNFDNIYIKNIEITNMKYIADLINQENNNNSEEYNKYSLNISYSINNIEIYIINV